jgi:hypothetical protein
MKLQKVREFNFMGTIKEKFDCLKEEIESLKEVINEENFKVQREYKYQIMEKERSIYKKETLRLT